ncbi:mercuric transporter MerT family protein [Rhodothermus marinus]|uniref:mercuric transporter MerT family protein n=1 Tax=Rhodothermus marinus TaxID=29549 RepID=UPI0012BA3CC8|nr:hypothetical protein RmaAA213_15430 [Rhodothermus marinus]
MSTNRTEKPDRIARSSLLAAIGAGVLASVCCVGPLAAVAVGVGGAWVSQLSALEPYRPFFVALALGALGLAWYREARRVREPDCDCETGLRPKTRRLLLGLGTVLVLGLLAAPSLIGRTHPTAMAQQVRSEPVQEMVLEVQGMTCEACSQAVVYALRRLEGVQAAEVTLEPPEARVRFDTTKVSVAQLVEAIRNAGFDATLKTGATL